MDFFINLSGNILSGSIDQGILQTGAGALMGGIMILRGIVILINIIIGIFIIISRRKVLQKANLPGRGILIPFYNLYLIFKLGGRPGLRFLWILFPPILAILTIIVNFDIAKKFNKHRTFGLGLCFIPIVFIPILAFDKNSLYKK